jgi:uncharacterized protein (TIGR00730 family)
MKKRSFQPVKAYRSDKFLRSSDARTIRILSEYLEPFARFEAAEIKDTIVFFGSARITSPADAATEIERERSAGGDLNAAEKRLHMSKYYESTRELAFLLTEWSKGLEGTERRFVVCSGGGPGIMEAANKGASEARGLNIGLNISLPFEQNENPYISRKLAFQFHYFFMRKFWFAYLAKAMVVMPGGFGTLDEFFEMLTLIQTKKIEKRMPIVLFGTEYWNKVLNLQAMVDFGTIAAEDVELFRTTDSIDEAYDFIVTELTEHALATTEPNL